MIREKEQILLRTPSDQNRVITLEHGQTINLGRFGTFKADALIGQKFGYTYRINPDQTISPIELSEFATDEGDGLGAEQSAEGHQIQYLGDQQMSMEEIEALKVQGVDGAEIIKRIQDGHASFDKKTDFSKEKYIKRKKSKYLQQFTPCKITINELLDIFIGKDPGRVLNMNMETLALALSYANVHEGGHYLVVDETPGLIAAAIVERGGKVTIAHESEHPNVDSFKYFSFDYSERVRSISFLDLLRPDEGEPPQEPKTAEEVAALKAHMRGQYYRKLARDTTRQEIVDFAYNEGYDGLIIASTLLLTDLVPALLQFINGSRPVVIYTEHKEPLVDAALALRDERRLLGPVLNCTRVRHYQTLPGRIHPLMTSRGYGGYLLSAWRVYPDEEVVAVGKYNSHRKRQKLNPKGNQPAADKPEPVN